MTFVNGARWLSGLFTGVLNWVPTAARTITLPDDSGTVLLDDRPVGSLNAGVSLRGYEPIVTVTATKTLALTDSGTVQNCTNAANATLTIPLNSAVAFPIGARIIIRKNTTFSVTLAWTGGVNVLSELGTTLTLTDIANFVILRKTGTDTWICQQPIPNNVNLPGNPTTVTQSLADNSTRLSTTAFVVQALANVVTQVLGNVSLLAANTTFVARSCRPIVIASRTTAFTFTTTYTDLVFDNKIRDSSNAYNATTGVFTAPYAGIYAFSGFVSNFTGLSTFTLIGIGIVANTELMRLGLAAGSGALQVVAGRQLAFLNSGDTRRFGIQVGGSNASGAPEASATSQVSCYMSIEYLGIDT